ncbi:MAG: GNAT family N-acetyltransferase [Acidobacteria bacterium]|nr:GNAT family N-acetyltransferase [Acidobacteriota bacterium]
MDYEIRQARIGDLDAVLTFCRRIWPERDYSESTWPAWFGDHKRVILVAARGERPIGVIRGEMMSSCEGWVEGVRIDPDYSSCGIGSQLLAEILPILRSRGAKYIRSLISMDNLASQRVFIKNLFRSPHRVRPFAIKRRTKRIDIGNYPAELVKLGPLDGSLALGFLSDRKNSRKWRTYLETTGNLYCYDGVHWRYWNKDHLAKHLETGEVWIWADPTLRAIAVVSTNAIRPGVSDVGLLEGSREACRCLLEGLTRSVIMPEGAKEFPPSARTFLPLELSRMQRAACDAGYQSDRARHKAMHLYEWHAEET